MVAPKTAVDGEALTAFDPTTGAFSQGYIGAVNNQTGANYAILSGDGGKLVSLSNAGAQAPTLPNANTLAAGWHVDVENRGAGTQTITPTTSTIDGSSTLALTTNQGVRIFSDGTNYLTQRGVGGGGTTYTFRDNLINTSNTIDWNPGDTTNFSFKEDFFGPKTGSSGSCTGIGEKGWAMTSNAGTDTCVYLTSTIANPGIFQIATSNVNTAEAALYLSDSTTGNTPIVNLSANVPWEAYIIYKIEQTTNEMTRVGFCDASNSNAATPNNFIGIRYGSAADTKFVFETRASSSSSTVSTDSINVDTNFHKFRIFSTVAGTIQFSVDGGTIDTLNTNVPTSNMMPCLGIETLTTAVAALDADFFSFRMRISR